MGAIPDRAAFIRDEFECFVRIGLDAGLRRRVQTTVDHLLLTGRLAALPPTIYMEARDADGALREMWYLETTPDQVMRLHGFLRRFTIDDVRRIRAMLGAPADAA